MSEERTRKAYSFRTNREGNVAAPRTDTALPGVPTPAVDKRLPPLVDNRRPLPGDVDDDDAFTMPVVTTPVKRKLPVAPLQSKQPIRNKQHVDEDATSPLSNGLLVEADEWSDDEDNRATDSYLGLGSEGVRPGEEGLNTNTGIHKKKRRRRFVLTARDVDVLTLLGKYRFGYRSQIEHYTGTNDLSRRLTQLSQAGYLRNEVITQTQTLWTPTSVGIDVAGLDVPTLAHGKISPSTIAHTIGLLNIGIDLEKGIKDSHLMGDPSWPYKYRTVETEKGVKLQYGENIITERMIAQAYKQQKALYSVHDLKHKIDTAMNSWDRKTPFGVEAEEGEEWMFVAHGSQKTHMPDMVLVRPRAKDGSSQHVAIELELNAKSIQEWRNILSVYKGSKVFKTVIYFTHKRSIANSLKALNAEHIKMGPEQFVVRKYIPVNKNLPFWG